MLRIFQYAVNGSLFDDFAAIEYHDAVGKTFDDAEVVGNQEDAHAQFVPQFSQQFDDLSLDGDVKRGGRFIRYQDFGQLVGPSQS